MFDAVILAGGQGSRMGGVSKADLEVQGERLLDRVLRAASGASTRVVVGDVAVPDDVLLTREDPPGTGPAAGIAAGLAAIENPRPWTLVLAVDLPDAPAAVYRLAVALASAPDNVDGLALTESDGHPQHLLALYRTSALQQAFNRYGDPRNRSVRGLVRELRLAPIEPGPASVADLDTPEQLAAWNAAHPPKPTDDRESWAQFVAEVCAELDLDADRVETDEVLRLTRRVAHQGARPMAPVAAYVLGLALGAYPDADPHALLTKLEAAMAVAPRPKEDD